MQVYSFTNFGYESPLINVETDLQEGKPSIDILGISDALVGDMRDNLKASFANSGVDFPDGRILLFFSPADLKKTKTEPLELAAALSVLNAKDGNFPNRRVFAIGELTLSGEIKGINNPFSDLRIVSGIQTAIDNGIYTFVVPKGAGKYIPKDFEYLEVSSIKELEEKARSISNFTLSKGIDGVDFNVNEEVSFPDKEISVSEDYLSSVSNAVKSIEIAIAGKHNILLTGAPGSGKDLLMNELIPALTPELTVKEAKDVTRIKSIAGLLEKNKVLEKISPFRTPHQSVSMESLVGGGASLLPGEISLAHNGTLFLSDAAEFKTSCLHLLRVPLENKKICLSRVGRSTFFPADFQLAMTCQPSPSGFLLEDGQKYPGSKQDVSRYLNKLSSPLIDSIEIKNYMLPQQKTEPVSISDMKNRIKTAYEIQRKRGIYNSKMKEEDISKYCKLDAETRKLYEKVVKEGGYSKKEIINLLRVSLTVANMDGREQIQLQDFKTSLAVSMNEPMRKMLNEYTRNEYKYVDVTKARNSNRKPSVESKKQKTSVYEGRSL